MRDDTAAGLRAMQQARLTDGAEARFKHWLAETSKLRSLGQCKRPTAVQSHQQRRPRGHDGDGISLRKRRLGSEHHYR